MGGGIYNKEHYFFTLKKETFAKNPALLSRSKKLQMNIIISKEETQSSRRKYYHSEVAKHISESRRSLYCHCFFLLKCNQHGNLAIAITFTTANTSMFNSKNKGSFSYL